ncbi:inorganic phosphate transporter Pho88 [Mucor mucedo]|nr:inorganic phosphate transporter Pho88 [Mucor mucedo]KAI7883377.1 inorganic phosphate transporter Pho88 [Mucor mucedo]
MARIGYYSAQVLVVGLAYGLMTLIKKKNDTTVLTYNAPTKPMSGATAPETITTTVKDYDIDQLKQFIQSTMTSVLIISVMHFQFKFTQPLLMQSILPIKNLITHKEALIHLWGDAPEGPLARPFVADNPLSGLTSMFGGGAATEATATPAATVDNHAHKD